ncbi:hypothetical protein D3261_14475 [Halococcus sp. IIIV-5B]|nr:hypothetical protein D3261_14475 [Halococcus sp. IIIV-5B]
MDYATAATVAVDPERDEPPTDPRFERVDDQASWTTEPIAGERYRISLPKGRPAVESLLDTGFRRWDLVVHTSEAWLYRAGGRVNVSAADAGYERDLRVLADERGALLVPVATLGHWTDGERWYEVTEGLLYVYPEDIAATSWEERRSSTTHTGFDVLGLRRIRADSAGMTIELSWIDVENESRFMRAVGAIVGALGAVLRVPDVPTTIVFGSREEFETALDVLSRAIGESSNHRSSDVSDAT